MENRFENNDHFIAHSTIAAGYFMMREAQKKLDKETGKLPIERMVDAATGADKERLDKHKQFLSVCLIDIIEAKKIIEVDYSKDEEFLALLNTEQEDKPSVASKAQ